MSLSMAERADGIYSDHGHKKNEAAGREREEREVAATSGVVVGTSLGLKECWWWLVQCVTRVTCLGRSHAITRDVRAVIVEIEIASGNDEFVDTILSFHRLAPVHLLRRR